jgi:hypothetical protein
MTSFALTSRRWGMAGPFAVLVNRGARRAAIIWAVVLLGGIGSACVVFFVAVRRDHALISAAEDGDARRAEEILDRDPYLLDHPDKLGLTPLMVAARNGRTDVLKVLIQRGADVNAKWRAYDSGDGQWNALHIAASRGQVGAAQLLIAAGTEVNAKTLRGETPLDVAVRYGRRELAEVLRAHGGVSGKQPPARPAEVGYSARSTTSARRTGTGRRESSASCG